MYFCPILHYVKNKKIFHRSVIFCFLWNPLFYSFLMYFFPLVFFFTTFTCKIISESKQILHQTSHMYKLQEMPFNVIMIIVINHIILSKLCSKINLPIINCFVWLVYCFFRSQYNQIIIKDLGKGLECFLQVANISKQQSSPFLIAEFLS